MNLGPAEILVVLVLALIVFGPKRLPEVGRQVGGALRELRRVQDQVRGELQQALAEEPAPSTTGTAGPTVADADEPDHADLPPGPSGAPIPPGPSAPPGPPAGPPPAGNAPERVPDGPTSFT
jgi:sec-independent protein translocase protein TatA